MQSKSVSFDVDMPRSTSKPSLATRLESNEIVTTNLENIQTKLDDAGKRRETELEQV